MSDRNESELLSQVQLLDEGYDQAAVNRFGDRLLRLARSRMPDRLQRRIDPEDIVQSVFRSFFSRHQSGQFNFNEVPDIWRLLAAITYRKVQRAVRHHGRQQRDFRREASFEASPSLAYDVAPTASSVLMLMELLDQILQQLPQTHQRIIQLRMEDHTIAEIAEQVNVSTRTVLRALKLVRTIASEISDES